MAKTIHVCLSVRGALRQKNFAGFQHDDGRQMTAREAENALFDELAKGHEVIPLTTDPCEGFDYKTGCPGHEVVDDSAGVSSLGGEFPRQQQRVRELLVEYVKLGPVGAFGAIMLRQVLVRADQAAISGNVVAMLRSFEELKECK